MSVPRLGRVLIDQSSLHQAHRRVSHPPIEPPIVDEAANLRGKYATGVPRAEGLQMVDAVLPDECQISPPVPLSSVEFDLDRTVILSEPFQVVPAQRKDAIDLDGALSFDEQRGPRVQRKSLENCSNVLRLQRLPGWPLRLLRYCEVSEQGAVVPPVEGLDDAGGQFSVRVRCAAPDQVVVDVLAQPVRVPPLGADVGGFGVEDALEVVGYETIRREPGPLYALSEVSHVELDLARVDGLGPPVPVLREEAADCSALTYLHHRVAAGVLVFPFRAHSLGLRIKS